jgi:hypothetical protein
MQTLIALAQAYPGAAIPALALAYLAAVSIVSVFFD